MNEETSINNNMKKKNQWMTHENWKEVKTGKDGKRLRF